MPRLIGWLVQSPSTECRSRALGGVTFASRGVDRRTSVDAPRRLGLGRNVSSEDGVEPPFELVDLELAIEEAL